MQLPISSQLHGQLLLSITCHQPWQEYLCHRIGKRYKTGQMVKYCQYADNEQIGEVPNKTDLYVLLP